MTIDKKTFTIQISVAVVVLFAIISGTWVSAVQYSKMSNDQCTFDERLKVVETKVAALERSGHDVDVRLAEIQKDLKYLVLMVKNENGAK